MSANIVLLLWGSVCAVNSILQYYLNKHSYCSYKNITSFSKWFMIVKNVDSLFCIFAQWIYSCDIFSVFYWSFWIFGIVSIYEWFYWIKVIFHLVKYLLNEIDFNQFYWIKLYFLFLRVRFMILNRPLINLYLIIKK